MATLVLCNPALAATPDIESGDNDPTLDTVVVNAASSARPIEDIQAAAQVLKHEDLEAFTGTSITEALSQAVGVDARALGSNSAISMRGFGLRPGALLVDGMRRPTKYAGVNASLLQWEDVDRIEIVRGPMSALHGADATGGAINVVTRSPLLDTGITGNVRLVGGATEGHQRTTGLAGASIGFGSDDVRHRVSVERRHRGLFRYDKEQPTADLNRLDQSFATYDGAYRIGGDHQLRWTLEYTDQDDTGPGLLASSRTPYTAFEREHRWFGAIRYRGTVGPGVLESDVGYGKAKASTSRSYPTIEYTDYGQWQGQMRYALEVGKHALLVGGGVVRDDIDITVNHQQATRTNTYLLAQDEWRLPGDWNLLVGVRHDRFTDFGSVTTPRLSLQRTLGPWRARLGYGEAYRAPSVLEQYSTFARGTYLITGNPDLKPETNKSWETALSYHAQDFNAQALYYRSRVSDLIGSVTEPRQPGDPVGIRQRSRYVNVARAKLQGVELSSHWRWSASGAVLLGWEYLDARDGMTDARLSGYARQIARAGLRWERGPWRTDLQMRYYFDHYAADPSQRNSAPYNSNYGTADVKLRYQATHATSIAAGIDNLFARRQPVNFNGRGSTIDPPTRFAYLELRHAF